MEQYLAFQLGNIVFIDSLQFMSSKLDDLAKNLEQEKFFHVKNFLMQQLLIHEDIPRQRVEFPHLGQPKLPDDFDERVEAMADYRWEFVNMYFENETFLFMSKLNKPLLLLFFTLETNQFLNRFFPMSKFKIWRNILTY